MVHSNTVRMIGRVLNNQLKLTCYRIIKIWVPHVCIYIFGRLYVSAKARHSRLLGDECSITRLIMWPFSQLNTLSSFFTSDHHIANWRTNVWFPPNKRVCLFVVPRNYAICPGSPMLASHIHNWIISSFFFIGVLWGSWIFGPVSIINFIKLLKYYIY